MSVADAKFQTLPPPPDTPGGVRMHRFTGEEFSRMTQYCAFRSDEPVQLRDGKLVIVQERDRSGAVPMGTPPVEIAGPLTLPHPQRRLTTREYHKLLNCDLWHPELRTELIGGWVVEKAKRSPAHDCAVQRASEALRVRVQHAWKIRQLSGLIMGDSEVEPDLVVVPGPTGRFDDSHPTPEEVAMLVEIADATLAFDRDPKLVEYAREGITRYWVVNLIDRVVEVFANPDNLTEPPRYAKHCVFRPGEVIPLTLSGSSFPGVSVNELIPAPADVGR